MVSAAGVVRWLLAAGVVAAGAVALGACENVVGIPERKLGDNLECSDGKCACLKGFGDCDGDPSNGCEGDLDAAPNCGACGHSCDNGTCSKGECTCKKGFVDCNGLLTDGCEAELATDAKNCGACGHDCEGGKCQAGRCRPYELHSFAYPQSILRGKDGLYVATCAPPPNTAIVKLGVNGGAPDPVTVEDPSDMASTDCGVFQTLAGSDLYFTSNEAILDASLSMVATPTVVEGDDLSLGFLGATSGALYWILNDKPPATTKHLYRMAFTAGAMAEQVLKDPVTGATVFGDKLYYSDATGTSSLGDTDTMGTLISADLKTKALTADAKNLYGQDDDGIEVVPIAGGAMKLLVPDAATFALASDGEHLYWFDFSTGIIAEIPVGGGDTRLLDDGNGSANNASIAFDDTAVYWLANDTVYKLVK